MARLKLDPLVDALQPPEIEIGGVVHIGKLLSAPEAVAFLEWATTDPKNEEEMQAYLVRFAEASGWPHAVLQPLRADVLKEVVAHFFACQGTAKATVPATPATPETLPSSG